MNAAERLRETFEDHGHVVKRTPRGEYRTNCPCHDDRTPSLDFREGDESAIVITCRAGCSTPDVLASVGLTLADLRNDTDPNVSRGGITAAPPAHATEYLYTDPDGAPIFRMVRKHDKSFYTVHLVGAGVWKAEGCPEQRTLIYNLTEVIAAIREGREVLCVEGERDVESARGAGLVATCNANGAGKWTAEHAAWLRGGRVTVVRDHDDKGRQHAAMVARSLEGIATSVRIVDVAPEVRAAIGKGADLTDHLHNGYGLDDLVDVTSDRTEVRDVAITTRLADVQPERLTWLWPGRLPTGKLVTLDGDPSMGKSTLAVAMAAHVSTGKPWPDGEPCPTGDAVILSAEDGLADTIRPRLDAAGGDPGRVHAITAIRTTDLRSRPPTLADVGAIRATVDRTRARLLIVDVLMAYLPGKVDSHRDQDVRSVLHQVADLADATGCTVLLLRHLNKSTGGPAMYRGGGSIGIVGAARAGYVVALNPDDPEVRVLACVKSNLAQMPPSMTYRLEAAPGTDVARVVWGGASLHQAGDLLRPPGEDGDDRREVDQWLADLMDDHGHAIKANDVYRQAREAGYSTDQVKRAKRRLEITARKDGTTGPWLWVYDHPEGSAKGAKGAPSVSPLPSLPSALPSALPSGTEPVCARCRRPADHDLINGRCRSCAYPPGTDSPHTVGD